MYTALVTGASRGIGAAIAAQLVTDGYEVITPTRSEMDLASFASIEAYVASITKPVDILVNNVGVNYISLLDELKLTYVQDMLQINLLAALRLIQALTSNMRKNHYGRIVNISSVWSIVGRPGRTGYAMSKAALNSMTRTIAVELAGDNVLINAVAPGYVLTDLTRQNNSSTELEQISKLIPAQRLAEPSEIAQLVAFLCSEKNTYLTGQTIVIDGGYTCL